jgi:hypothetical protein
MAPTPNTRTDCPDWRSARRNACNKTDKGSARAARSNVQLSGNLEEEAIRSDMVTSRTGIHGCRTCAG